ncbi:MAG: B12-binding domain-containing radical SAM protein, partial [Candidatus Woesearchaeota archaeon]|nr:B12-binding domain-containing radical SAM protein [Candidatus Woesearchaeota archaeon]
PPPWSIERPPLGLATISSFLRAHNIRTSIIDINIELYHRLPKDLRFLFEMDKQEYWIDLKKVSALIPEFDRIMEHYAKTIAMHDTKIIGFSVSNPKEFFTIGLINKIRELDKTKLIIIGGSVCASSDIRKKICRSISYKNNLGFVIGEGESTIYDVIMNVKGKKMLNDVPGLALIRDDREIFYKPAEPLRNLDHIGFPRYEEFYLKRYTNMTAFEIEWSRGCIANCVFCFIPSLQGKYRYKSADARYEEIMYLSTKFRINTFSVCDSIINGNIKELEKFCDLIISKNIKIRWSGQMTPLKAMSEKIYSKLKQSGCYRIEFGIESGSDATLKRMKKLFTSEVASENLKACKKAGIQTVIYLMVGFPNETESDLTETLRFLDANKENIDLVRSLRQLYLMPDTYVDDNLDEFGIVKKKDDLFGNRWSCNENDYAARMDWINKVKGSLERNGIEIELIDR